LQRWKRRFNLDYSRLYDEEEQTRHCRSFSVRFQRPSEVSRKLSG
jgi:hypothetical protein